MSISSICFDDAVAVAPSDSATDPKGPFAGFYVGVGGDVTITTASGNTTLFKNAIAGVGYAVRCVRINVTGTTATNIVGLIARP